MEVSPYFRSEVKNIWKKKADEEDQKIKKTWERKIIEMKSAYEKDKEKLQETTMNRFRNSQNVTFRSRTSRTQTVSSDGSDTSDITVIHGITDDDTFDNDDNHSEGAEPEILEEEAQHSETMDENEDVDDIRESDFSNETWNMINDIANNFGDSHPVSQNSDQSDNQPHFRDVDHRTIPHNFCGIPVDQQMGITGKILQHRPTQQGNRSQRY